MFGELIKLANILKEQIHTAIPCAVYVIERRKMWNAKNEVLAFVYNANDEERKNGGPAERLRRASVEYVSCFGFALHFFFLSRAARLEI